MLWLALAYDRRVTLAPSPRRAPTDHQFSGSGREEKTTMFALTVRYARYALSALNCVGFLRMMN